MKKKIKNIQRSNGNFCRADGKMGLQKIIKITEARNRNGIFVIHLENDSIIEIYDIISVQYE